MCFSMSSEVNKRKKIKEGVEERAGEYQTSNPLVNSFLKMLTVRAWGCSGARILSPLAKKPRFNPRTQGRKQEDEKFKINISYTVSCRPAELHDILSRKMTWHWGRMRKEVRRNCSNVYNVLPNFCTNHSAKHINPN